MFATDLSTADRNPFRLACSLADALGAKLLIVHASDAKEVDQSSESRFDPHMDLSRFVPRDLDIEYEYLVEFGDPPNVIRNAEKARGVDLIVLGTRGRKGMDRLFAGSVAERVIRGASCPVVTLMQRKANRILNRSAKARRILVPTDFSAHSYAAMQFACALARPLNARITVLHVTDTKPASKPNRKKSESKSKDTAVDLLEQLKHVTPGGSGVEFEHIVLHGDPSTRIAEFADERGFDFVVVGTHGRSGIKRALIGSVAEQVVRNCQAPVVCVKLSNKRPLLFEARRTRKSGSAATHRRA
jgi:nucleotide-binding universal stress UspA family protein